MTPVITEPEYLTQGGLAQMLQVSVRTVQRKSKQPGFPRPICIGRCYRWSKAEVEDFLRENRGEERV
jgi:predicted DNA-binding transcriptional regulator AlpA